MRGKEQAKIPGSPADDFLLLNLTREPIHLYIERVKIKTIVKVEGQACQSPPFVQSRHSIFYVYESGRETDPQWNKRRSYGAGSGALSESLSGAVARVDQPCPAQWRGCESRREGWRGIPVAGKIACRENRD